MVIFTLALALVASSAGMAQPLAFKDVVKRVEAKLEPATAKRGETVKWVLTIELIPEWHTYPTKQKDADFISFTNKYKFPKSADIVFAGDLREPKPGVQKEKEAELLVLEGKVVIEHDLVVSPNLKPGKYSIKIPVRIAVCNKETCLKPEDMTLETIITVSDAPPVAVDPKYQKELEAAGR
jgi:DsbC/DsbD-like thiol-disulfide interchange protein